MHGTNIGLQGNQEESRTDSHVKGIGPQGAGTFLTIVEVEQCMKNKYYTQTSEKRRASDPMWIRETKVGFGVQFHGESDGAHGKKKVREFFRRRKGVGKKGTDIGWKK